MEWKFINNTTITEKSSGYTIHLISGTWSNPLEIKPEYPKNSVAIRHEELLRRGLEFAFDYEL